MALRHQIEYAAAAALLGMARFLPERGVHGLFQGIARMAYLAMGQRRELALRNLAIVFPDMSPRERRRIAVRSYQNIGDALALNALVMANRITDERLLGMIETDGWEDFLRRKAGYKEGVLAVTGHLGNWELLPHYAGLALDGQLHAIARQSDNPIIERKLVMPLRERFGTKVFYKKHALLHVVKAVRRGAVCALLLDQKLNPPEGFYIDFCGRRAPTGGTPALLQIRFGIPVQPVFMVRTGHQKYRLILPEPIPWEEHGDPVEEQVRALTILHQNLMEQMIRRYPEQWFWMHNRWGLKKDEP